MYEPVTVQFLRYFQSANLLLRNLSISRYFFFFSCENCLLDLAARAIRREKGNEGNGARTKRFRKE